MAAVAKIDRMTNVSAEETDGVVTKVVRSARVIDLSDTDYQALFSALTALGLAPGSALSGAPNLVLRRRNPSVAEDDPHTVDVELVYEHVLNSGQNISAPPFEVLLGEVSAVVSSVKSNVDIHGDEIVLEHRYPTTDINHPGETILQGAEIEFLQPQTTMSFRGIKTTSVPWLIQRYAIGAVNASPWSGGDGGQWLCTNVSFKVFDTAANRYEFSFEFQFNVDGWDPQVRFIDDVTGKPPINLVSRVGYLTVERYPRVDFESILGVRSQGG
jgi:hypothetical protein